MSVVNLVRHRLFAPPTEISWSMVVMHWPAGVHRLLAEALCHTEGQLKSVLFVVCWVFLWVKL